MIRVAFHPEAAAEMFAAARFYETQAAHLGIDFLALVQATCNRIARFPDLGHAFGGRLRRTLVPRFPYAVVYEATPDSIRIVAVANLFRHPQYWRDRL